MPGPGSNFTFTFTIPAAANNPSTDQGPMLIDNASIVGWSAVDHLGYNTNNGGIHNVIHFNDQGVTDPGAIAGFGQEYTKTIAGDQQLFYESGAGIISQLTGPVAPSVTSTTPSNGYSTLPGGVIIQWGTATFALATTGTVNFTPAFPNNCFVVVGNSIGKRAFGINNGYSKTSFTWATDATVTEVRWIAIGN